MPHIVNTDDAPLTQDFQTQMSALPPIEDSQPSTLTDGLDLNSSTSNCGNIIVTAPPAVDHDNPSASGFSSLLEENIEDSTKNINDESRSKEIAKAAFLSRKISFIRQGILAHKDSF